MVEVPANSCAITSKDGLDIVGIASGEGFLINDGWEGAQMWLDEDQQVKFTYFDGNGDEIGQYTATCGWSVCQYGPSADWSEKTIEADSGDVQIGGDRIAIVQGFESQPDSWPDVSLTSPELSVNLTDDVSGGCTPVFDSVNIELSNDHFCKNVSGDMEIVNEVTGQTTTETFDINPGDSTTVFYSFEVDEAPPGEQEFLTINVNSSAGNQTITRRGVIGNQGDVLTVEGSSAPSEADPGDTIDFDVDISNGGECEEEVTVELTNDANSDIVAETSSIFGGGTSTVRLDYELPEVNQNKVTFTADVSDASGNSIDTVSKEVETTSVDVSIEEFDAPSEVCVDTQFNISASVTNNGDKEGDIELELVNNSTGSTQTFGPELLNPGNSIDHSFTDEIPLSARNPEGGVDDVTYVLNVRLGGRVIASETVEVFPKAARLMFADGQQIISKDSVCVGSTLDIEMDAENFNECPGRFRIRVTSKNVGQTETSSVSNIAGDSIAGASVSFDITPDYADRNTAEFDVALDRETADGFVEESELSDSIQIRTPELVIEDVSHSEFVEPGEYTETISITNQGNCPTQGRIQIGSVDEEFSIQSNSSTTFRQTFNVVSDTVEFNATLTDQLLDIEADARSISVSPHKFVELNTASGRLDITGGYDVDVNYKASIIGSDVEGENLESVDTLKTVMSLGAMNGNASPDSEDIDTITFTTVQLINMEVGEEITWIVDDSIDGKSTTFQYSTVSSSAFIGDRQLPAESPEIEVMGGPLNNVGAARRKFGIDVKVFKKSLMSRL